MFIFEGHAPILESGSRDWGVEGCAPARGPQVHCLAGQLTCGENLWRGVQVLTCDEMVRLGVQVGAIGELKATLRQAELEAGEAQVLHQKRDMY